MVNDLRYVYQDLNMNKVLHILLKFNVKLKMFVKLHVQRFQENQTLFIFFTLFLFLIQGFTHFIFI